eukprot:scaffold582_cov385-Prasinococcus_capsulatus_cf.AAC.36
MRSDHPGGIPSSKAQSRHALGASSLAGTLESLLVAQSSDVFGLVIDDILLKGWDEEFPAKANLTYREWLKLWDYVCDRQLTGTGMHVPQPAIWRVGGAMFVRFRWTDELRMQDNALTRLQNKKLFRRALMLYKACAVDAGRTGLVIAEDARDVGAKLGLDISAFDSVERFSRLRFYKVLYLFQNDNKHQNGENVSELLSLLREENWTQAEKSSSKLDGLDGTLGQLAESRRLQTFKNINVIASKLVGTGRTCSSQVVWYSHAHDRGLLTTGGQPASNRNIAMDFEQVNSFVCALESRSRHYSAALVYPPHTSGQP